jgi:hypothetical protein
MEMDSLNETPSDRDCYLRHEAYMWELDCLAEQELRAQQIWEDFGLEDDLGKLVDQSKLDDVCPQPFVTRYLLDRFRDGSISNSPTLCIRPENTHLPRAIFPWTIGTHWISFKLTTKPIAISQLQLFLVARLANPTLMSWDQ